MGLELSAENGKQLFIPAGYGHGFLTMEPDCEIAYKVDDYYAAECDGGIAWDCPTIGVDWPLRGDGPVLSDRDTALPPLTQFAIDFRYDGNPLAPLVEVTA